MKTLFKAILVGLLIGNTALAGLPPTSIKGQSDASPTTKFSLQVPYNQFTDVGGVNARIETGNQNLLKNPSFEAATPTASWGGTGTHGYEFTVIADGRNSINQSFSSTSDTLEQSVTPLIETLNRPMMASCQIKTSSANVKLCAMSNGVEQACTDVPASGSWNNITANFVGPANGTSVGVRVKSTSGSGSAYVDDCYVGLAKNIAQVSQAQLVGTVKITGSAGVFDWGTGTGGTYTNSPTQTGTVYTTTGAISAPSTNIAGFKMSGGAGEYMIVYTGWIGDGNGTGGAAFFRMTDGTNVSIDEAQWQAATGVSSPLTGVGMWHITESSAFSNLTFQLQAHGSSADPAVGGSNAVPGAFTVYYFPSQSQTVIQGDLNTASWSGYQTLTGGWSTSSSTYADPTGGSAYAVTPITARNVTCTQSGSLPGIDCTLPKSGMWNVCAYPKQANSSSADNSVRLVTGTGTIINPGSTFGTNSTNVYGPQPVCGKYNATSAGTTTFKVQLATTAGTTVISNGSAAGSYAIMWTVDQADTPMGSPVIVPQSGDNVVNYMTGGNGEKNANICSPYQNTAAVAPTTGTGGSPTVTCGLSSIAPISGAQSYALTKPASNVQGQGWSFPFTVDSAGQAKMLQVSFDYQVDSNYVVGSDSTTPDIVAYVYGPTDGTPQLTQLTPYKALGGAGTLKFQGNFQTAASGTAYRLILHEPNTGTLSSTIKVDNIAVSPVLRQFGTPVTDWQPYTPALTGYGTVTNLSAYYRRVGDTLEFSGAWTNGASASGVASIGLPAGLAVDTTKLPNNSSGTAIGFGSEVTGVARTLFSNDDAEIVFYDGATSSAVFATKNAGPGAYVKQVGQASRFSNYYFKLPIQGWSSSTQMSDQSGDNRQVVFSMTTNASYSYTAGTPINFPVVSFDSTASYSAGTFTVPSAGYYRIDAADFLYSSGTSANFKVMKNGSFAAGLLQMHNAADVGVGGSALLKCNAGDTITIVPDATGVIFYSANDVVPSVSISRSTGNQQIAATEKVYLQYTGNAGTSLTASVTDIDYTTKVIDSHGAWNGTQFKAPRAGWYNITGGVRTTTASPQFYIYVNGVQKGLAGGGYSAGSFTIAGGAYLNAGDLLSIRSDTSITLGNLAVIHHLEISSQN